MDTYIVIFRSVVYMSFLTLTYKILRFPRKGEKIELDVGSTSHTCSLDCQMYVAEPINLTMLLITACSSSSSNSLVHTSYNDH